MIKFLIKVLKPTEGRVKSIGVERITNVNKNQPTVYIYLGQVKMLGLFWSFNVYAKKLDARNAVSEVLRRTSSYVVR